MRTEPLTRLIDPITTLVVYGLIALISFTLAQHTWFALTQLGNDAQPLTHSLRHTPNKASHPISTSTQAELATLQQWHLFGKFGQKAPAQPKNSGSSPPKPTCVWSYRVCF